MYVVRDDFPINYKGILGLDFLNKQQAKYDYGKKQVRIDNATFKLYPYKKTAPRSETIIQTVTNRNSIGIVNAVKTKSKVFIGNCLVVPEENVCPISIINTTGESVEITTPLITVDEIKT
ncbi:hypothetical protein P5V15_002625 [Pogonomyrmex californicus]